MLSVRHKRRAGAVLAVALGGAQIPAWAGGTITFGDDKSVSVGGGLRTSFTSEKNGAPNGTDRSKKFAVDDIRLYLGGQVTKQISLTFNTERQADSTVRVLDAIAQFAYSDLANVWMGRFLPPSDRSNLDGPFYLSTWSFPFVQNYPALFAGRDDGAAFWGQVGGGKFKYQVGAFQGRNGPTTSNQSDSLLYAGRLTWNLWDPEPGYYNASTYYGAKNILAFGLAGMSQKDGASTAATPGDFKGWNVDALMEKKLAAGNVLTLEGAYYKYDLGGVADASLVQGKGYLAVASYLIGKIQPQIRYQQFNPDGGVKRKRYDYGVNYIINGHDARVSLVYSKDDMGAAPDTNIFTLGVQLQI